MKATDFGKIINTTKNAMENHLLEECKERNIGAIFFPTDVDKVHATIDDYKDGHIYVQVLGFMCTENGILLFTEQDVFRLEEEGKEEENTLSMKYILITPEMAEKNYHMFGTDVSEVVDPTELLLEVITTFEETISDYPDKITSPVENPSYIPDIDFEPIDKNGKLLQVGDKVKWIDPAVEDYETEEEYHDAINNRVFEIFDIDNDTEFISITDGSTESEVFCNELIKVEE